MSNNRQNIGISAHKRYAVQLALGIAIAALLTLGGLQIRSRPVKAQSGTTINGLDVIVIIDNSTSMKSTDPSKLRIQAAQAFVGKLKLSLNLADTQVGVVSFGADAKVIVSPTNVLEDRAIRQSIVDEDRGATNFDDAFNRAFSSLGDTTRQCAFLLFTDGQPDVTSPMTKQDMIEAEFQKVQNWVDKLKVRHCRLFIGATGIAKSDGPRWNDFAQATGGIYQALTSINDIVPFFHTVAQVLGIEESNVCYDGPVNGRNVVPVFVEPYLRSVTFFIQRENTQITMDILDPGGNPLKNVERDTGGTRTDYDQGVLILTPTPGTWHIDLRGNGRVWCWKDYLPFQVEIAKIPPLQSGTPLTVEAKLLNPERPDQPITSTVGYTLALVARVTKSDEQNTVAFNLLDDSSSGQFIGQYPGPTNKGKYIVDVAAIVQSISPPIKVNDAQFLVNVGDFPSIESIALKDGLVGEQVAIETRIANLDTMVSPGYLSLTAVMVDPAGTLLNTPILLTPKIGTNSFIGTLGAPDANGKIGPFTLSGLYTVTARLQGQTADGLFIFSADDPAYQKLATFRVTDIWQNLPHLLTPTIASVERGQTSTLQIPVDLLEKADVSSLLVPAQASGLNGTPSVSVTLALDPSSKSFMGVLGPFTQIGTYTATASLSGTALDGTPLQPPVVMTQFSVNELASIVLLQNISSVLGILAALAVVFFVSYKIWFAPKSTFVLGKVIIRHSGDEIREHDISDKNRNSKRIVVGSPGDIELGADPTIAGSEEAIIMAWKPRRGEVYYMLRSRKGGKWQKEYQIYDGDRFEVGSYTLEYNNSQAKREAETNLEDKYAS